MQGEMTLEEIKAAFVDLKVEDNTEELIEYIKVTGQCPVCGKPLTIKEHQPDFWEHGSVG